MSLIGNVIVGQSGGPTSVINCSLVGVYKTAKDRGAKKIYGMLHGIRGLLEGKYVDLSEHITSDLDIEILKRTPSSFLFSCRYKLEDFHKNDTDYKKIFDILHKLDIKHFFYIGGNDSMDTIKKLSEYAKENNESINFIGIPKTIDNDLAMTDHSPGYGSAAKYIGSVFKEIIRDGLVYGTKQVTIVEIMGRNAGWLTAASALSKGEDCEGPDMIILPEIPLDLDRFIEKIGVLLSKKSSLVIAISEGVKTKEGNYICELNNTMKTKDSFGHTSLGGAAYYLANLIANKYNCKTRPIELSTLQRCSSHMASRVDITEAYQAGGQAVRASFSGETGKVAVFVRTSNDPYSVRIDMVDVDKVANIEKKVPLEWITEDNTNVSKELVDYIRPLIQAELSPTMVDGLPRHLTLRC